MTDKVYRNISELSEDRAGQTLWIRGRQVHFNYVCKKCILIACAFLSDELFLHAYSTRVSVSVSVSIIGVSAIVVAIVVSVFL